MNYRLFYKYVVSRFLLPSALLLSSQVQALEIKLGHVLTQTHSWHIAAEGFAKEVLEKTEGRVQFIIFPNGQIGNEKTMIEGLQIGSQGAAIIGTGSLQPLDQRFGITELPYTWKTAEQAHTAYDGELGQALEAIANKKNIVILSWWDNGFRHITNNRGPIQKPEDLAGLKIRVTPDKMRLQAFQALGANPAPLAFGELYSALQQKVFDGQENPLSVIYTSSFYEVQKYLSLTQHVWGSANLIISQPVWKKITPNDQAVIRQAANTWRDKQRQLLADSEQAYLAQLKEKGMLINTVDQNLFSLPVQDLWKQYQQIFGADLMNLVQKYRTGN